jgi:hypothetical protein
MLPNALQSGRVARTRLKLFKSLMTRKGGAILIATPESVSPDFAK